MFEEDLSRVTSGRSDWDYLVSRALRYESLRVLSLLFYARSEDRAVPAEAIDMLYEAWEAP